MLLPFKNSSMNLWRLHLWHKIEQGRLAIRIAQGTLQSRYVLGRDTWSQTEPWSFTTGNQGPMPELIARTFFIEKYARAGNCINFFKATSNSLSHSRLYIGHLPCPHKTTALVCQKCSTWASCLASCPLSNSCPINVPPRYRERSKGRELYP